MEENAVGIIIVLFGVIFTLQEAYKHMIGKPKERKEAKKKERREQKEMANLIKERDEASARYAAQEKEREAKELRKLQKARAKRKKNLIDKYGDEIGSKISIEEIWIDMTKEMLIDSWGKPEDTKEDISRNKVKLRWYYEGRETRQGTTVYKHEVRLENDIVEGWKELE